MFISIFLSFLYITVYIYVLCQCVLWCINLYIKHRRKIFMLRLQSCSNLLIRYLCSVNVH